jgi:hypothetical protein
MNIGEILIIGIMMLGKGYILMKKIMILIKMVWL